MAYGLCEVQNLPTLFNFEQARKFFNRTKPLRGSGMQKNERPMHPSRGGAYKKFRVGEVYVWDGRMAYDLIFYDTNCIRYYEPNPDGSRHVVINYYASPSTREFMWRHGWGGGSKKLMATDGKEVYVPFCHAKGDYPSAFLTFDTNNKLITSRSWHAPICKMFSSDEDKQRRKDFKRVLGTVFDLLYVQEYEIRAVAIAGKTKGGWAYSSHSGEAVRDLTCYVNDLIQNPDAEVALDPSTIEFLLAETSNKLREMANNAASKEAGEKFPNVYNAWEDHRNYREERTPQLIQTMDMKLPITATRDTLLERCGFMTKNEHVQLPMFLDEPPKGQFFYDKKGEHLGELFLLSKYKNV